VHHKCEESLPENHRYLIGRIPLLILIAREKGLPEVEESFGFWRRTQSFSFRKSEDFRQEGFFKSLCFIFKKDEAFSSYCSIDQSEKKVSGLMVQFSS
jgi:hypothetical protein